MFGVASATAAQELAKAVGVRLGGRLGLYELTHRVDHATRVLEGREVPGLLQQDEAAARHGPMRAARRQGASEEEVREVLRQVAVYAGFPSAWNALATMRAALKDFDEGE